MSFSIQGNKGSVSGPIGGSVGPVAEDDFTFTVRRMADSLRSFPGRVSERGIRQLARNNKFELFEDTISVGKRISLGGAIILIDIDLKSDQDEVSNVNLSLASTVNPSNPDTSVLSKSLQSTADSILLKLLKEPRLDRFAKVLSVLATTDRLSLPNSPDCFVAIDEIATALIKITNEINPQKDPSSPYGVPGLNRDSSIGLSIHYWTDRAHNGHSTTTREHCVHWQVREKAYEDSQRDVQNTGVRYSTGWVSSVNKQDQSVQWNEPEVIKGTKAEFVLVLDPPIMMPDSKATELNATISSKKINDGIKRYKASVYSRTGDLQTIDFIYSSLLRSPLVEVTEIPISHPKDLPNILGTLRQHSLISALWQSVTGEERRSAVENEHHDENLMSFADAIVEEIDSDLLSGDSNDNSKSSGNANGPSAGDNAQKIAINRPSTTSSVTLIDVDDVSSAGLALSVKGVGTVELYPQLDGSLRLKNRWVSTQEKKPDLALLQRTADLTRNLPLMASVLGDCLS
uniref:Mediator of RNA polymerase II transcription subunit 1 n=1 Tax=Blastobotrys adeninivorans TaxID=409370 RepID=A0A060T891_BLAAD